ncbi:MAG: thioredoxin [Salinivirgaceae bacterium]|jgi:thioredoxin 1|nr:thioredoxin [Salinivirgaceae bacterium]
MNKFMQIINSDTPVLVDFYADWCAPCKMMPPILKQVKDKLGDNIRIIKIDSDKNHVLSQKYQIRSIPTIMLFQKGEVKWQNSGVMQASQLISTIENFTN